SSLLASSSRFPAVSPPHLLSFPTRRSSDLLPGIALVGTAPAGALRPCGAARHAHVLEAHGATADGGAGPGAADLVPEQHVRVSRSEEHTSELQSHLNLVCRLLLEKKKQAIY